MSNGNSWYAHYPGDYSRDTSHLSLVQHGAYRLLLDHYYSTGSPLPKDEELLCRICRAFRESERKAVSMVLKNFFVLEADGYHNARGDRELAKQLEKKEKLSASGRRGAQKRWPNSDGEASSQANGHPMGHPNGPANSPPMASHNHKPQPQPSINSKEKPLGGTAARELPGALGFDRFYAEYPHKKNRVAADKAWRRNVKPSEVERVFAGLEMFKAGDWRGKEMQFIPYPASWLNGRRWTEEPETGGTHGNTPRKSNGGIEAPAGKYADHKPVTLPTN